MRILYHTVLLTILSCWNLANCQICGKTGTASDWWCAKDNQTAGTTGSTIDADSCFCVQFKNQTQKEAFDSCETFSGFLTDIQNVNENILIGQLLMNATAANQTALTSAAAAVAAAASTVAPAATVTTASTPAGPCGSTGVLWNGMCYSYSGSKVTKTWPAGEAYCASTYIGGHLTSVKSAAEQDFLGNLTKNCSQCTQFGYWVGGNNYGNKTNWSWSDNSSWVFPRVTTNPAWPKQPDAPAVQNCVVLVPYDNGWGDWYCKAYSLPYVCSYPVPNPAAAPAVTVATQATVAVIVTTMAPITYTPPPAWIGLYLTAPGLMWSKSTNCPMASAEAYQNLNQATQSMLLSGYVYGSNQKWANADATSQMTASICRKDRNICGRNVCPSCSTCTPSSNKNCYTCS